MKIELKAIYKVIEHGTYWKEGDKDKVTCPECGFEQEHSPDEKGQMKCENCDCIFEVREPK